MIHPLQSQSAAETKPLPAVDEQYKIVAWENELPSFDPLPMVKTVLLSPRSLQGFNRFLVLFSPFLGPFIFGGLGLRFAAFIVSAPTGRILAPISAFMQIPGMVITLAHMRTEYMKIIMRTFDFCFLQAANTLWALTFCVVLNDRRMTVVLSCWVNFTCWLLQETYLRKSYFIVVAALWEWLFFVGLLPYILLELLDGVHHYNLFTAHGHSLSTKDVITNIIGTMTMLTLRNLYRRYQTLKLKQETTTQALGYRCNIALSSSYSSTLSGVLPANVFRFKVATQLNVYPPLEMHLATESMRFDPQNTVQQCIGSLSPLSPWKIAALYASGGIGGALAVLSLLLPENTCGIEVIAILGLILSSIFAGVWFCCCQRQLLKRLATSFHYWFLSFQVISAGIGVIGICSWRWIPSCGVASSLLSGHTILLVDALTPAMKRRLCFRFWMPVGGIGVIWIVHILLLLGVFLRNNSGFQDSVFLNVSILGRQTQLHVAPFLLSRVVTIIVWFGRYAYIALTRPNDNALVLLRGDVEFDYEGWKKQIGLASRRAHHFF